MASDKGEARPQRDPKSLARSIARETPVRDAMRKPTRQAPESETGSSSAPDPRFLGFIWDEAERAPQPEVGETNPPPSPARPRRT